MIVLMSSTIKLSEVERVELSQRAVSQAGRADSARRARLILLLAGGDTWSEIREKLSCNDDFIDRWSKRFNEERLAGLFRPPCRSGAEHAYPTAGSSHSRMDGQA